MCLKIYLLLLGILLVECGGLREKLKEKMKKSAPKFVKGECKRIMLSCEEDKKNIDVWFSAAMKCKIKAGKKSEQREFIAELKRDRDELTADITECPLVSKCDKSKVAEHANEFRQLNQAMRKCESFNKRLKEVWVPFKKVKKMVDETALQCEQLEKAHLEVFTKEKEIYKDFMQNYWVTKKKCT